MKLLPDILRKSAAALVLVPLAGIATIQTAKAESISCPLSQIRREVVTPLPTGWWSTPIINSLQGTRIVTFSNGSKALQCRYGAAGNIQRKPPAGKTCQAVAGGFTCSGGAAHTFSTGIINLRQTYLADFDRRSSASRDADIWFEAETNSLLYLVPRNGAQMSVGNRSNRGFAGCSSAHFSTGRVSLSDVPVGSYVCVKTNEGRISQFRMNQISAVSPKILKLGYTTWQ